MIPRKPIPATSRKVLGYVVRLNWSAKARVYVATMPALPAVRASGRTIPSAIINHRRALIAARRVCRKVGVAFPSP